MKVKTQSTGLHLLGHLWENQGGKSWDAINHSMMYALRLGIGSHLTFSADDIAYCEKHFRVNYWLGEHGWEVPYALAVTVENASFIQAFEEHANREPFFGNRVTPLDSSGFTHGVGTRARCRLALYSEVVCEGRRGRVTSINNEQVVVVVDATGDTKRRVLKLCHDDCRDLWPAPKKPKASKAEEATP